MSKKAIIGLSGGIDSTTLLGILLEQNYEVHCCLFYYGSKHNEYENKSARNIINWYQNKNKHVSKHFINISEIMQNFSSDLLLTGGEIPEGHYEAENMRKTVVPGRNLIFASIMAGLAESVGAGTIALGVHQGDHYIYPDCRKEFIKSLDATIYLSSDKNVEVITPLLTDNKENILRKGYDLTLQPPYHLTRTCYKNQELSCGKCGSCRERIEAFHRLNKQDPVPYEIPLGVM